MSHTYYSTVTFFPHISQIARKLEIERRVIYDVTPMDQKGLRFLVYMLYYSRNGMSFEVLYCRREH